MIGFKTKQGGRSGHLKLSAVIAQRCSQNCQNCVVRPLSLANQSDGLMADGPGTVLRHPEPQAIQQDRSRIGVLAHKSQDGQSGVAAELLDL